jgi:Na+/proline symporter
MHWIDWTISALPLVVTIMLIVWSRQYVKGVSDFLTAGRVAGRYLLAVSGYEASQEVFGLLATYEAYYQSGFAYGFWGALNTLAVIIMALTGYGVYRFRQTRAMTMGQFLEMRYSRRFRIFAGSLQAASGVLNYGLFPGVSGKFFVYFCGLPTELMILGTPVPTYLLIMAAYLAMAATLAISGGQLSIMVADCVVGVLSYPLYLCIVGYIVWKFSWFHDFAPPILDRPSGHSLINPFDIHELRDFNVFYVVVGIFSGIVNRLSWSGNQGFAAAGRTAHEHKMAGVLQIWRTGFSMMMYILVPVLALSYFNSSKFAGGANGADACQLEIATKTAEDVLPGTGNAAARQAIVGALQSGDSGARSVKERVQAAQETIKLSDPAAAQSFSTIFRQMSVPMALRYLFPIGLIGAFCAICISLLMATDSSYQHSWAGVIVQDIVLPLRKRALTPKTHLLLLRLTIVFVAAFAFFFSCFFGQIDYILMFQAITGAIWLGGSGPCIMGGLYWSRGTTAAAWFTLIAGSSLAVFSMFAQKFWVGLIYPWLLRSELADVVGRWLAAASAPFEPYIKWRVGPDQFPINSQELFFITMLISVGTYVVVSFLTSRERFNMDKLLHRGCYKSNEELEPPKQTLNPRGILSKLIGIDNEYTRGDRLVAWSVFIWSFGWTFGVGFVGVALWNWISPWGKQGWSVWFYVNNFLVAGLIGVVSTVWFSIGGTKDLLRLFRDLKKHHADPLDDGRVLHAGTSSATNNDPEQILEKSR